MTGNNFSHNISSTLKIEPPGFLYVDHIAISECKGELENHVKMYEQIGFKVIHREEIEGTDQVREVLLKIGESPTTPDEQADPFETSIPLRSSFANTTSFLWFGMAILHKPGTCFE